MKKLLSLIFSLFFAVYAAEAQTDPGFVQNTNVLEASQDGGGGGAQAMFQPLFTPITQTASAIAEQITPDIQALADSMGGDPTRIFNYVHDQIRHVYYYGSKKGAELTLLERSGNDFDQCALLSALLQASGYSPTYQYAMLKMPYDTNTLQDLHHWLGLNFNNTNWVTTSNYFAYLVGTRGAPVWYTFPPDTNTIALPRVWVALTIAGTNYYLDPAFKVSLPVTGQNLATATGLTSSALWSAAGGTDTGYSVSGLNEATLRGSLQSGNSNLLGYISNNIPDATIAQVIGGEQIVSSVGLPLRTNLQFSIYTNSSYLLLNWTNQPTNFMGQFSITFAGTNQTWFTPQLEGQRLSLTFDSNALAQLWLDDSLVLQTTNTGPANTNTLNVIFSATHPYGGNGHGGWNTSQQIPTDGGVLAGFDRSSTNAYQRTNSSYAIMYGFDPAPQWLQKRQQKLDAYRAQGLADTSRQVTTETLNVMGLGWMVQTELAHQLLCQEWGQSPESQHRFGRMGQEQGRGYYVDVYLQLDGTLPSTGEATQDQIKNSEEFDVDSYFASAMEHGIIEQLQNSNLIAASTVKMLEIANTNSQTVYLAYSGDWTTGPNVRGSLVNYDANTISTLNGLISQSFVLLLPQNGSNHIAGAGTWAGNGYVELGTQAGGGRSMGMIINGAYNGGYVSNPNSIVNPPFVAQTGDNQPTFFNPQSPFVPFSGQTGADPVNLVDGSFEITSGDLTVGQTEPRGLNLTRSYSSTRLNSNPAGMAPGWLNSYYCNALPISDPEGGLGTATIQQAAPMIVAAYAALNLYTNNGTLDPKNWATTALIAKWGVDQLINNAVSVNLGNHTIQFLKQPDSTYTPPANCNMTLTQASSAFVLQERHGRTFKFNTNSVLTNIVDQYGRSMTLKYNSNNLVTNVTDWTNRTLSFTYTNGFLASVADSTGRSVSYGYSGGELTSYTDPEQKTTTYAYDTSNELVATFDAASHLVESNYYDGAGHIMTQLTQGDTNKMWQVYASGYQTVEIDPAGDTLIYTYDSKSRLISFQDGMGNITQTSYDGQDHVIQTVSSLGETNQFIYNGNNNMVESIDPLGFSNVFTFDANNNLIATTDGRGNACHFGYNSQFDIIGSTNGNGDYFTLVYNSDGTLHSRTDSGGATTYSYDTYGLLNNITYPSSLGSESFVNSALGDSTSHTDVRGFTTTFAYNNRRQLTNTVAPTNLTIKVTFDPEGNVSTTTDARGYLTSNNWSVTRKLLSTTLPPTPQGTPVVTSAYDNRDWLGSTQNPLGKTAYYTNDAAQRLIATTDPLQRTTRLGYDNDGRQTTSTDAASEQTTQTFDARGEIVKIVDGAGDVVSKAYDGAGNLIYLTNRNGKVWQFQYDGANRLTNTISPLSRSSSQIYNNRGLLQSSTDPMSHTTSLAYDARGRMSTKTDSIGVNTFNYDGNNNVTSLTSTTSAGIGSAYDAYNRVTSFTNAAGYVIQYRYDASGNVTNLIYPGNLTVKYFYDSNNRLTNITDWSSRQTVITYDLAGHVTSIVRPNNTLRAMNYDDAGELTNIVEQTTTKFPIAFHVLHYNLAARTDWEFKGPLPHSNSVPTRTMTYDNDNRLSTFNGNSVTLDSDGNLTYGPLTNNTFGTYAYDARNELTSAGGVSYGYDLAGNRTSLTNSSTTNTFVINPKGSQVLMRIKPGVTNYYIYGAGLLYEIDVTASTTATEFYHFDCRGSTVALTDGNGNLTDEIEYSPYGTTAYRAGATDTPFCFNGQFGVQTDPNGLLYMRARYYNPYICRFVNPDPSGFSGGLNFYQFANGNPISMMDPTGLGAVGDNSAAASWINNASGVPANLSDPFGVNANNPSTGTLVGNGLNNTVSAIGQTIGQGLYDLTHLQFSTAQYNQIANTMYSTATPENPAATPYVEGALAVSGAAALTAGAAGTWAAAGLPTMNVAVGAGEPFHVAYGVGGTWVNAVGSSLGNLTVSQAFAADTAASAYFTVTGIPVVNSAAVVATGGAAWTCVTAAGSAFVRGWLP
jgi:RHS repeat-associated protein